MKTLSVKITLVTNYELSLLDNSDVFLPCVKLDVSKPLYKQVFDIFNNYVNRYARRLSQLYNNNVSIVYTNVLNVKLISNLSNIDTTLIYLELNLPASLLELNPPLSNTAVTFRLENALIA